MIHFVLLNYAQLPKFFPHRKRVKSSVHWTVYRIQERSETVVNEFSGTLDRITDPGHQPIPEQIEAMEMDWLVHKLQHWLIPSSLLHIISFLEYTCTAVTLQKSAAVFPWTLCCTTISVIIPVIPLVTKYKHLVFSSLSASLTHLINSTNIYRVVTCDGQCSIC